LNNPDIENEMLDEYSYFPDKPETPSFLKPSKTQLNIPEFKLTKDKKDRVIPQFRTETKNDLRKDTFGTKKSVVIEPKKDEMVTPTNENVEVITEQKGMSLGTKIGIGLGALVLVGLGVYLIRKNK